MACLLSAPIDKLMLWRHNCWKKFACYEFNLTLRVHCDQLLITSGSNVIESLNVKEKLKGIFKEDVLILYIGRTDQEIRKIKFRIKSNAHQCFEEFKKYFSVVSYDMKQSKHLISPQFRNVEQVLTRALNIRVKEGSDASNLPPSFKNFVRLCLLDPSFPKLVEDTSSILDTILIQIK